VKRKTGILILVISSVFLSLVLAELLLRTTGVAAPPAAVSATESQAAQMPGMFVPRKTVVDRSVQRFPHRITVNSLGYRGPEPAEVMDKQTLTILFAGDSFTWGYLVSDEETLPSQLQRRLARNCPGVTVLNAGIGGTTIVAQSEMIRRGLTLDPDLVILQFYDNDVAEMEPPVFWDVMADNRRKKSTFPLSLAYSLLNETALWVVLRRSATRVSQPQNATDEAGGNQVRGEAFWAEAQGRHREEYAEVFHDLAHDLHAQEVPLMLFGYPSHLRLADPDVLFNHTSWLTDITQEAKVPFHDLAEDLMAQGLPLDELYFLPWDGHARPIGYEIASARIAREVLRNPVVRRACQLTPD
jgi:hypothetical protein